MVKNETYLIEGMSCASCAAHIEESLKQVDNLSDVNVNFATSKLTLSRGEGIDRTEVEKIVEKSGYKLTYVSSIEERTFILEGMSCATCAKNIEDTISSLDGTEKAIVNFATEKMVVKFDKEKYLSMGKLVLSKRSELEEIAKNYMTAMLKVSFYRCRRYDRRIHIDEKGH